MKIPCSRSQIAPSQARGRFMYSKNVPAVSQVFFQHSVHLTNLPPSSFSTFLLLQWRHLRVSCSSLVVNASIDNLSSGNRLKNPDKTRSRRSLSDSGNPSGFSAPGVISFIRHLTYLLILFNVRAREKVQFGSIKLRGNF